QPQHRGERAPRVGGRRPAPPERARQHKVHVVRGRTVIVDREVVRYVYRNRYYNYYVPVYSPFWGVVWYRPVVYRHWEYDPFWCGCFVPYYTYNEPYFWVTDWVFYDMMAADRAAAEARRQQEISQEIKDQVAAQVKEEMAKVKAGQP